MHFHKLNDNQCQFLFLNTLAVLEFSPIYVLIDGYKYADEGEAFWVANCQILSTVNKLSAEYFRPD
jgi:hypothetical protein